MSVKQPVPALMITSEPNAVDFVPPYTANEVSVPLVPLNENVANGLVVPAAMVLPKYALPVVVAPPLTVRPPVREPLPIVDEAATTMPSVVVGASAPLDISHDLPKVCETVA